MGCDSSGTMRIERPELDPGRYWWGATLGALFGLALDVAAAQWLTSAAIQRQREHPGPAGASQGIGVFYLLLLLACAHPRYSRPGHRYRH